MNLLGSLLFQRHASQTRLSQWRPKARRAPLVIAFVGLATLACGGDTKPASGSASNNVAVAAVPEIEIPQSIFIIPSSPREGRNPFFPLSTAATPPPTTRPTATVDVAMLSLNGLTSPPRRTAIINGYTFEPGEEHEVRIPGGGREPIKCIEIKDDSATVLIRGQRRELRLRSGL